MAKRKGKAKTKQLSFDDLKDVIFPVDVIERLQARSDGETNSKWEDGDDCGALVDEFGPRFGKSRVRRRFAIERQLSNGTARDRENMARFFNPQDRLDFDVLSYHQLRACKPAGKDGWRKLATWAVESADDYGGRPAPVDAIIRHRKKDGAKEAAWERRLVRAHTSAEQVADDPTAKPSVRKHCRDFVEAVAKEVERIDGG